MTIRSGHALLEQDRSDISGQVQVRSSQVKSHLNHQKVSPSHSETDVGVERALAQSGFDRGMFQKRGGEYDWKRDPLGVIADGSQSGGCNPGRSELDW